MTWLDWLIVLVPLVFVLLMGRHTRIYIRSVADYLTAGRSCGRYVMCVADVANALSIMGLVAFVEVQYKTGMALSFWQNILMPLGIILGLTGYCYYRFRETKAMSLGQFLELRYNRKLRVFAAAIRSVTEVCANMIMPAIGARFFIYFLDIPQTLHIGGFAIPTFMILLFVILAMALSIICYGGETALTITDSIQGMICYPLITFFIVFVLCRYSWSGEIVPVMSDRVADESFLNPYDIESLRDFNVFFLVVTVLVTILHRGSWIVTSGAKSAHENKMSAILGSWRGMFNTLLYLVIGIAILTVLNHEHFAAEAKEIRVGISERIATEIIAEPELRQKITQSVNAIPEQRHIIGVDAPLSQAKNLDTPYLDTVHRTLLANMPEAQGHAKFQEFSTLYHQLTLPVVLKKILPPGLMGLFCLLMVLAMLSTDDTRIFSSSLTIAQDVILPFCKKELTPKQHIWMIRTVALTVGACFFLASYFMAQLDYINLFVTIICTVWMGGCGPVIIFGLYSRFGTTAGAFTSLITSLVLSVGTIFVQRNWAEISYPFLEKMGWVEPVGNFLAAVSKPFNPYIVWEMNPVKCPINSYEFYFMIMVITLILYCVVSKLTMKEPFNLDRMLHRGIYNDEGKVEGKFDWRPKYILSSIIGITPEYTRGDRFIAWGFFLYSFVYTFLFAFVGVAVWNWLSPWPLEWWSWYFLIVMLVVPGIMTVISMVWFMIGGVIDIRKLFHDLSTRTENDLDNGRVEGNVSLSDRAVFEAAEAKKNDER